MAPSGSMAVEVDAIAGSVPDPAAGGKVWVTWYTDPHNVWCWGCEPMMRRLEIVYPDRAEGHLRMGGLFEDFSPVCEQWARMSGGRWTASVEAFFDAVANQHRMPMDAPRMLGSVDDFDSTWPACIAAKAAEARGRDPGRRYLRALREAWCLDGRGIHRRSVQIEVAREVGLDTQAFSEALGDGSAERAVREGRGGGWGGAGGSCVRGSGGASSGSPPEGVATGSRRRRDLRLGGPEGRLLGWDVPGHCEEVPEASNAVHVAVPRLEDVRETLLDLADEVLHAPLETVRLAPAVQDVQEDPPPPPERDVVPPPHFDAPHAPDAKVVEGGVHEWLS